MTKKTRKLWSCFFLISLIGAFGLGTSQAGAESPHKTITGTVAQGGFNRFILRTPDGTETTYNTGRETVYHPADYREQEGDKVKVTFYPKEHRGRTILAVSRLELITANPNVKKLSNPATGTITEVGRRAFNIHIPEVKKVVNFEKKRGMKILPTGWNPTVDEKVKISYEKVPARFGRGYVYIINTFEKIE